MNLSEARAILGVAADAPLDEVRRRYLELAQANHPDRQPPDRRDRAGQVTGSLNAAWELVRADREARGEDAFRPDSGPAVRAERPAPFVPDPEAASAAAAALGAKAAQRTRRIQRRRRIVILICVAAVALLVWRSLPRYEATASPATAPPQIVPAPTIGLLQQIDTSGLRWGVAEPDLVSGLVANRTGQRILGHVTLHMVAWNVDAPRHVVTRSFPLWADWPPGAVEPISVVCGLRYGAGRFPVGRGTCCLWFEPAGYSAYRMLTATFRDGRGCVVQAFPGTSQHDLRLVARRFASGNPLLFSADDLRGPVSITSASR
ncbi:MAG: J domain-containing protein [Armatimonadetes bacterium]|nr:J domain-containing protein [Armatimonadota bacterium]MDE2207548.1 J domain-containing protein [Armatimonadota bacterium]